MPLVIQKRRESRRKLQQDNVELDATAGPLLDSSKTTSVPKKYGPQFVKLWSNFATADYLERRGRRSWSLLTKDKDNRNMIKGTAFIVRKASTLSLLTCGCMLPAWRTSVSRMITGPNFVRRLGSHALIRQNRTRCRPFLGSQRDSPFHIVLVGEVNTTSAVDIEVMEMMTKKV